MLKITYFGEKFIYGAKGDAMVLRKTNRGLDRATFRRAWGFSFCIAKEYIYYTAKRHNKRKIKAKEKHQEDQRVKSPRILHNTKSATRPERSWTTKLQCLIMCFAWILHFSHFDQKELRNWTEAMGWENPSNFIYRKKKTREVDRAKEKILLFSIHWSHLSINNIKNSSRGRIEFSWESL